MTRFVQALTALRRYVERERFSGPDPYDLLASPHLSRLPDPLLFYLSQIHKRNPINCRPLLGIADVRLPKAMGLFLKAYSRLAACENDGKAGEQADLIYRWLRRAQSSGYPGASWGLPFEYVSRLKQTPAWTPSVVVTAFVQEGLCTYYEIRPSAEVRRLVIGAADFIVGALQRTRHGDTVAFSYYPHFADSCFNANALAAAALARAYAVSGRVEYREAAGQAAEFVVAHKKEPGYWNMRILGNGTEKRQVDFHQGFIVDSLAEVGRLLPNCPARWMEAATQGWSFYLDNQFADDGRAFYRWPARWPTDIHHQSQGILTAVRHQPDAARGLKAAMRIADWSLKSLQLENGSFCYRRYRGGIRNKIPFMRWGQAWMFLALVELTTGCENRPMHSS